MGIFISSFFILSAICFIIYFFGGNRQQSLSEAGLGRFQGQYLLVYVLAQGADWLQGPHVYALFSSYGMSSKQIGELFVVGFGSSMIFGTVIGSFADKFGRKLNCILYGVLYSLDCLAKHVPSYSVLMCGRIMGGIATSILFSAFESWLVCEHGKRQFSKESLGVVFSNAVLANSLTAITCGLVAQAVAVQFGFVAPFSLSIMVMIVMCVVIFFTWTENYGDASGSVQNSLLVGFRTVRDDPKVLCLGLIQSLFEGSMYTFVLEWTPALTPAVEVGTKHAKETIPHGWIFASYMVAVMLGSCLFKFMCKISSVESFMRPVFAVAAVSLAIPIVLPENQTFIFLGFLVFECCVGIFWPALGTMRGKYVPEQIRATVMNIFRIPLNFIVIVILLQDLGLSTVFNCCVVFLVLCMLAQHWLCQLTGFHSQLPVEITLTEKDEERPTAP